jgi:hypothetical protein
VASGIGGIGCGCKDIVFSFQHTIWNSELVTAIVPPNTSSATP